jgi:hypothetical protein
MPKRTPSSLVAVLLPEVFQAEQSVATHCGREAARLGNVSAGLAMRAISNHAKLALPRLRELAVARGQDLARGRTTIGRLLSNMRDLGGDVVISQEKSYRGALLGIHHGVDAVLLLEDTAVAGSDQALADFCGRWLRERTRLVGEVERDIAWFASNPDEALRRAMPAFVRMVSRSLAAPAALRSSSAQAS